MASVPSLPPFDRHRRFFLGLWPPSTLLRTCFVKPFDGAQDGFQAVLPSALIASSFAGPR